MNLKAYTVTQYAKRKKVSRQSVLAKIARGTLNARKVGHYWIITA